MCSLKYSVGRTSRLCIATRTTCTCMSWTMATATTWVGALIWIVPIHRCVLELYTQYLPESCEKISQAYYSDGIWTHNPRNSRAVSYQLDYRGCPLARDSFNPMFWQRGYRNNIIDVKFYPRCKCNISYISGALVSFIRASPYHVASILVMFLRSNNNKECWQSFCK